MLQYNMYPAKPENKNYQHACITIAQGSTNPRPLGLTVGRTNRRQVLLWSVHSIVVHFHEQRQQQQTGQGTGCQTTASWGRSSNLVQKRSSTPAPTRQSQPTTKSNASAKSISDASSACHHGPERKPKRQRKRYRQGN